MRCSSFLAEREGPWCPGAESNRRHRDFQSALSVGSSTTYRRKECL